MMSGLSRLSPPCFFSLIFLSLFAAVWCVASVSVVVAAAPAPTLSNLAIRTGILSPTFAPTITTYNLTITKSVSFFGFGDIQPLVPSYNDGPVNASNYAFFSNLNNQPNFSPISFAKGDLQWSGGLQIVLRIQNIQTQLSTDYTLNFVAQPIQPNYPFQSDATILNMSCTNVDTSLPPLYWEKPFTPTTTLYNLFIDLDLTQYNQIHYRCQVKFHHEHVNVALAHQWDPMQSVPVVNGVAWIASDGEGFSLYITSEDGTIMTQYTFMVAVQGKKGPDDTTLYYLHAMATIPNFDPSITSYIAPIYTQGTYPNQFETVMVASLNYKATIDYVIYDANHVLTQNWSPLNDTNVGRSGQGVVFIWASTGQQVVIRVTSASKRFSTNFTVTFVDNRYTAYIQDIQLSYINYTDPTTNTTDVSIAPANFSPFIFDYDLGSGFFNQTTQVFLTMNANFQVAWRVNKLSYFIGTVNAQGTFTDPIPLSDFSPVNYNATTYQYYLPQLQLSKGQVLVIRANTDLNQSDYRFWTDFIPDPVPPTPTPNHPPACASNSCDGGCGTFKTCSDCQCVYVGWQIGLFVTAMILMGVILLLLVWKLIDRRRKINQGDDLFSRSILKDSGYVQQY